MKVQKVPAASCELRGLSLPEKYFRQADSTFQNLPKVLKSVLMERERQP